MSRWFAEVLPLASIVDFLRWPLGLQTYWPLQLAWLLVLIAIVTVWGWLAIYKRIYL